MSVLQIPHRGRSAAVAYDNLADVYDMLTSGYSYDRWLREIQRLAIARGVVGRRLLDLACGTGKSFLPMAELGYEISACDISPRMVEIARQKAPTAEIAVADMRDLGPLGEFDLITCLDDSVNYLLENEELNGFFTGIARNLAPDGLAVFDVNSLRTYTTDFGHDWLAEDDSCFVAWSAQGADDAAPDRHAAVIHIFSYDGTSWNRRQSRHEQRHWSTEQLRRAASGASLEIVATYGQHRGAVLEPSFDEMTHTKALHLAAHRERR